MGRRASVTGPREKRGVCPDCGKRGLGPWKAGAGVMAALNGTQQRDCRYCGGGAVRHVLEQKAPEQCKHTTQTAILSMRKCSRLAVKDGYCTRHHPNYISPGEQAALAAAGY